MARAEIGETVASRSGRPISGASVQVNKRSGSRATVYTTETGGATVTNPLTTDAYGRIEGWLSEGSYDLVVTANGTSYTQRFEAIKGAAGASVFSVTDGAYGATGDGVTSDTAAIQAAITASGGSGIVYLPPGIYYLNGTATSLKLPRSAAGLTIRGAGRGATTIKLSASTPRVFDFDRTTDYQIFQNITIEDLTVDANSITGINHVLIGNYIGGNVTSLQRCDVDTVAVRRVTLLNVPSSLVVGTTYRPGIYICGYQPNASEATRNYVRNITVEDYRQEGGNTAIAILGDGGSATGPDLNVVVDNIAVRRWYHSVSASPPVGQAAAVHVQIGSRAFGGDRGFVIEDGYGENCSDSGIETDQISGTIARCKVKNAWGACFLQTQFSNPLAGAGKHVVNYIDNIAYPLCGVADRAFYILGINQTTTCPRGTVYGRGNKVYVTSTAFPGANGLGLFVLDQGTHTANTEVVWEDFSVEWALNYSTATPAQAIIMFLTPASTGRNTICIRNYTCRFTGANTSGQDIFLRPFDVSGPNLDVTVDGLAGDYTNYTGLRGSGARLFTIGVGGATTFVTSPVFRGVRYIHDGDQVTGFPIDISSANITVAGNTRIHFEDCDFSQGTSAAGSTYFASAAVAPFVRVGRTTWSAVPATGVITLTSTVAYQLGSERCFPGFVQFVQGTGTVTLIEYSVDGTNYITLVSQGAAAVPTGATIGPLWPFAKIRATFTVAPTVHFAPSQI